MPYMMTESTKQATYEMLKSNYKQLSILAQWALPTLGTQPLLQIFTAAPSFQDAPEEYELTLEDRCICNLLMWKQYTAVAQIAAMRSLETAQRVPLHLTLVGQGAFRNPPRAMEIAFKAVCDIVSGYNVDVYFHGYSPNDIELINKSLPNGVASTMSKEEFFS